MRYFLLLFNVFIINVSYSQDCFLTDYCIKKFIGDNYKYALICNEYENYSNLNNSNFNIKTSKYFTNNAIDSILNIMGNSNNKGTLPRNMNCNEKWKYISSVEAKNIYDKNQKISGEELYQIPEYERTVIHFAKPIYYEYYIIVQSSEVTRSLDMTTFIFLFKKVDKEIQFVEILYSKTS